jgi:aconitate hydratase
MDGQVSSVALMDARSIAATARNGGYLCSAESLDLEIPTAAYHYDDTPYRSRVYDGAGKPQRDVPLRLGPNITDWPVFQRLGENLLVRIVSFITDPVTTTDELIPSGETSSYRSNPIGLAEYTLSRKDPAYVGRAKAVKALETSRLAALESAGKSGGKSAGPVLSELASVLAAIRTIHGLESLDFGGIQIGSAIFAVKPGDGSAREQAASCQRVLGGSANFAGEYATKRYRSNLINWGIIPFILDGEPPFKNGDHVFIPRIAATIREGTPAVSAYVIGGESGPARPFTLKTPELTPDEREIILKGCLINYNKLN